MSSKAATFNYYYSTVVENSDVQLLLLDCRREQRRSITITRLSSRTATLKSCARRSSTIVTRLKDEYINWWRERENDIISLGSQNPFYQPFPVLQMKFDRKMTSRRRMSSSSSISSFQRAVDELLENERMTARLSTQDLQFTSFTQNTMSFSQRSTQNEDDDETERRWDMNLQYDEEDVNE
jgi:hypothetical protein